MAENCPQILGNYFVPFSLLIAHRLQPRTMGYGRFTKFDNLFHQRELRREFRQVFARATLVLAIRDETLAERKQFKFLFKFVWIINQLMTLNLDMFLHALR